MFPPYTVMSNFPPISFELTSFSYWSYTRHGFLDLIKDAVTINTRLER